MNTDEEEDDNEIDTHMLGMMVKNKKRRRRRKSRMRRNKYLTTNGALHERRGWRGEKREGRLECDNNGHVEDQKDGRRRDDDEQTSLLWWIIVVLITLIIVAIIVIVRSNTSNDSIRSTDSTEFFMAISTGLSMCDEERSLHRRCNGLLHHRSEFERQRSSTRQFPSVLFPLSSFPTSITAQALSTPSTDPFEGDIHLFHQASMAEKEIETHFRPGHQQVVRCDNFHRQFLAHGNALRDVKKTSFVSLANEFRWSALVEMCS
jgi:hypothetical protein